MSQPIPAPGRRIAALLSLCLLLATPALAAHPDEKSELENLRKRIELLESTDTAKSATEQEIGLLTEHLSLHGLVEVEAGWNRVGGGASKSDLTLATAELDVEVSITEFIGGHVKLLYEDDDLGVDEAVISLTCPESVAGITTNLHAGRLYLPFGRYGSYLISDPLPLELGETSADSLVLELRNEIWSARFAIFGDDVSADDGSRIDQWVAAFALTPVDGVEVGVSFLNDLAESGAELVTDEELYRDEVAAASVYLSATLAQFGLEAEYLTALDDFDRGLVEGGEGLSGQRPAAWNLELAWMPAERWQLAARYERAEDFLDDPRRIGTAVSYGLYDHLVVALEYLHTDFGGGFRPGEQTVTGQLALAF